LSTPEIKAVIGSLGERDESAEICSDRNGNPECDSELRDTENVPLKESVEEYFKREILPHVPDAWIDESKTKVGYEIPLNRHFYIYEPPRELEVIEKDIEGLEQEIMSLLREMTESGGGKKGSATAEGAISHGRYRPYPKYKPSGIEWLGKVPEEWDVGSIRHYALMRTGHTPSRTEESYWENCIIPWFTLADVWQLRDEKHIYLGETNGCISRLGLANSAAELLPAGTVIFSRTASIGFSGIMPVPMATSQDFWNWIPGEKIESRFLLYIFRSMHQEFEKMTMGSTHKTIYQPDAASICICVPPIEEQHTITDFLDRETTSLDALVDKNRTLIERLKEKRSTLISRTVTRGLPPEEARAAGFDPNPKLKDSGVEWLKEIPYG
jgi:hypothetical protein